MLIGIILSTTFIGCADISYTLKETTEDTGVLTAISGVQPQQTSETTTEPSDEVETNQQTEPFDESEAPSEDTAISEEIFEDTGVYEDTALEEEQSDGEILWTEIWSHPLNTQPAGSEITNGAWQSQGVGSIGGRVAWRQNSDHNRIWIPVDRSTSDWEAVEVDVYKSSEAGIGFHPLGRRYVNGIEEFLQLGFKRSTSLAQVRYGGSTDGHGQSNGVITVVTDLEQIDTLSWQTLRVEYSFSQNIATFYVNGTVLYTTDSIPIEQLLTDHISLVTGIACCSTPAGVAWSNLRVYEGH
jgi:hypothetical protein